MRRLLLATIFATPLFFCTAPARADCQSVYGEVFCTPHCWVHERWRDADGREWMNFRCAGKSADGFGVLVIVGVIVLAIAGACGAFSSAPDPFKEENEKIATKIEEMKALETKLTAAAAEADNYLKK